MTRPFLLLALVILAGSAALRVTGLDWLLPSIIEQDAHIPVQVRLMEVAPVAGAMRFELLSEGTRGNPPSSMRRAKRPSRSYGPKGRRR